VSVHASESTRVDYLGVALIIAAAIAFSAKAIFVKLAYTDVTSNVRVDPVTLLTMRMGLSLPLFAVIAWWSSRQTSHAMTQRDWVALTGIGLIGYYGASLFDFWGLMYISAALERLILFLNPTIVVVISALALGYRITARDVFALVISYAGIALVFAVDLSANRDGVLLGSMLVLISAILYAVYLVGAGQMIKRIGAVRFAAYASIVSCVAISLHFLILRDVDGLAGQSLRVWGLAGAMALVSTVLPIVMMAEGMRRIGSSNAAMMSSIGPISTILLGYVFLGEPITATQMIGAGLVLAGVLVISLKKN
jgi:drug/metabolite transporter (DMT)-like permease